MSTTQAARKTPISQATVDPAALYIETRSLIEDLSQCWPNFSPRQRSHFEKLIRKVDIAKRLDAEYASGWRRLKDSSPLDDRAIMTLVKLLTRDAQENWKDKPRALRSLNAALNAKDLLKPTSALPSEASEALERLINQL